MSAKRNRKMDGKTIKYVEPISKKDMSGAVLDISNLVDNGWRTGGGKIVLNYVAKNGNLVEQAVRDVQFGKEAFTNSFNESTSIIPVRIGYVDGSEDTGFKMFDSKRVVNRRNSRLVSLFTRDGTYDMSDGTIIGEYLMNSSSRIPAWLVKLMPFYNENIRSGTASKSISTALHAVMHLNQPDIDSLNDIMLSDAVERDVKYGELKFENGSSVTTAYKVDIDVQSSSIEQYYQPIMSTWNEQNICTTESGWLPSPKNRSGVEYCYITSDEKTEEFFKLNSRYVCCTYLKSVYFDNITIKKVFTVIPVSDILNVIKVDWNNENTMELWNNLDSTVSGRL